MLQTYLQSLVGFTLLRSLCLWMLPDDVLRTSLDAALRLVLVIHICRTVAAHLPGGML